ncbi:undecaprenyldiphospho-muramoylpentapeptide beta-N-acetylglucosaminyltransferase [Furfurilactobacillus siliginis]|uniref:UDP-N-acetylglucosamine--N-acetylmuramyl-(pentapeptide) pyrophosphoryl-undecaprenol N-acetylglucosamine transferase n=2 Tax=Furfurilactobacillus siliginis TaxID=348151 RepID=A0A510VLZ8_9LACO|nr:undecaprenyldiphospho-muramoylpentapeptide beta-N-acetylglucosaminyltransferase [Furfurilactobacillus siliginis]GEK27959.1 UDP-N-acetylglucosamine--N-acetylmuramyl-(pentapeptide) pyrophosphoryl-undecaprenol N-acetylglucosamine transferase [Furfurilactobacillus siliginis]
MRLMVSGGGTGGHIYPALALIDDLKAHDEHARVCYVGTQRGLESKIVPARGIQFETIKLQGFSRKMNWHGITTNVETIHLFLKGVRDARKIIKDFQPDVVVGTGGYVSSAVLYAASRMGIPTLIHEQNSVVGVTNKFLSRFVNKIAIAFADAKSQFPEQKVIFTGNPRAQQVAQMHSDFQWSSYELKDDVPTLLIFGGSQGALKINAVSVKAIPEFNKRPYQVVFVTGQKRFDDVQEQMKAAKITLAENVKVVPYISNMPEVLPKVAAIVGRAGATSLAEITALGIASILIPSPYVTNDHQTKNAMSLVNQGAAEIITEADLSADTLMTTVDQLMTDEMKRTKMAAAARKMGVPDAADQLLKVVTELAK